MQDIELNSVKLQLENLKSLIFSNNIDLLSYAEKLYTLISKNKFLNEEIEKRNMYFQELYSDNDFNNKILPPLIKRTLQDPSKEKIMAFSPVCRYEKAEELKKENWKGFYTDLFFESSNFDLTEAKLLDLIDKQTEAAYKKFCELAYEIPKEMYVREIHYYLTIIRINDGMSDNVFYRKVNEKFLTELLNLKEAALNLTSLITFLIFLIDSKSTKGTINLNYLKSQTFSLKGEPFLENSTTLTYTLYKICNNEYIDTSASSTRSDVSNINKQAKKILKNNKKLVIPRKKRYIIADNIKFYDYNKT